MPEKPSPFLRSVLRQLQMHPVLTGLSQEEGSSHRAGTVELPVSANWKGAASPTPRKEGWQAG